MKRRPIYRWKSFWLGVLVLGFLLWVWAHSMGRASGFGMREGRECADVFVFDGDFTAISYEDLVATPRKMWGYSELRKRPTFVLPKWAFRLRYGALFYWVVFPLWVPVVGWLAVWGGWMVWRWRRVRGASAVAGE